MFGKEDVSPKPAAEIESTQGGGGGNENEGGDEHVEELVFDQASGSMISKSEYEEKAKNKIEDPFGNPEK